MLSAQCSMQCYVSSTVCARGCCTWLYNVLYVRTYVELSQLPVPIKQVFGCGGVGGGGGGDSNRVKGALAVACCPPACEHAVSTSATTALHVPIPGSTWYLLARTLHFQHFIVLFFSCLHRRWLLCHLNRRYRQPSLSATVSGSQFKGHQWFTCAMPPLAYSSPVLTALQPSWIY
jgi:hypothetical protein